MLLFCSGLLAQETEKDIIILKSGAQIEGKLKTIKGDSVSVLREVDGENQILILSKSNIGEIQYGNSAIYTDEDFDVVLEEGLKAEYDAERSYLEMTVFPQQSRHNIKFHLTEFSSGTLGLSFERALSPNKSVELSVKAHGWGLLEDFEFKNGIGIEVGYKMKIGGLFSYYYLAEHLLSGTYFKPFVGFGSVNERSETYFPNSYLLSFKNRNYGLFGLDMGHQWIFGNRITMDLYCGVAYYNGEFESVANSNGIESYTSDNSFEDGDIFATNRTAIRVGFRVGFAFSKYDKSFTSAPE